MLDDRSSFALNAYFEPTLNSKANDSYSLKKDYSDELDTASCLEANKLLDEIKYETLADEMMLNNESNMNFVNSYLSINDQIVYSNQLPDEIFETEEEETSNGFYDKDYDLLNDKPTNHANSEPPNDRVVCSSSKEEPVEPGESKMINGTIEDGGLSSNLGERLPENLNFNLNATNQMNNQMNLTSNSNGNSNSNLNSNLNSNEVKVEPNRTERQDAQSSPRSTDPPVDQPDGQHLTNTINLISSTTPINSINLANLVDSTMASTISAPIISTASLPLIGSLHNTNGPVLSGPTTLTATSTTLSLPSTAILSNSSKLIEPGDPIVNGALSKTIAKKKLTSKTLLAELDPEQIQNKRRKLWSLIAKKDIPKAYKSRLLNRKDLLNNCKKLAQCCQKERNCVIGIPKLNRERSKKSNKETYATYWKLNKRNDTSEVTGFEPPSTALAVTPVQLTYASDLAL